jgi:hypothetical protein
MDETTIQRLHQYLQALKALQRSVERAMMQNVYQGTGRMAVKTYRGIQTKIAELLPDDFYVTDTLALEVDDSVQEEHTLSQVQLAANQMIIYVEGLVREGRGVAFPPFEAGDLRTLGRDLQEQIMRLTQTTLRRALSNVDVDVAMPGPNFRDANLDDANLEGANLSGRSLRGASLVRANLRAANLSGANLKDASLQDATLEGANLAGANVKGVNATHANFTAANLTGANFRDANLEGAVFTGAQISGTNFYGANLMGAILPDGSEFARSIDLARFNASAGHDHERAGRRVHIEINTDDDDDKPKRGESPEPPVPTVPPVPPTPPEFR